jgi:hypothetical protein
MDPADFSMPVEHVASRHRTDAAMPSARRCSLAIVAYHYHQLPKWRGVWLADMLTPAILLQFRCRQLVHSRFRPKESQGVVPRSKNIATKSSPKATECLKGTKVQRVAKANGKVR